MEILFFAYIASVAWSSPMIFIQKPFESPKHFISALVMCLSVLMPIVNITLIIAIYNKYFAIICVSYEALNHKEIILKKNISLREFISFKEKDFDSVVEDNKEIVPYYGTESIYCKKALLKFKKSHYLIPKWMRYWNPIYYYFAFKSNEW